MTGLPVTAPPAGRTGSIYDLGYRRYEGPRLGRGAAMRALVSDSFRTSYGIGHGGRAKVAPIILGTLAILPAVVVVGVLTLAARTGAPSDPFEAAVPLGYDTYYRSISALIALFCAAQAPELFARDQRHGVVALYFAPPDLPTTALSFTEAAVGLALLALLLFPMLVLLIGRVLLSTDIVGAFGDDLPKLPAVIAQALVIAGLFGSLSMAISAHTPRRAYATAGIIALFVLPGLVAQIVIGLGSGAIGTWLVLVSPGTILDGTNALFFGHELPPQLFFFDLPLWTFLVSATAITAIAVGIIVRRFVRMPT